MTIRFNRLAILSVILSIFFVFGSEYSALAQIQDMQSLTLQKPVERELKGDEFHSYTLTLQAGQFLNVVVEQKGIDVVVALFDPGNKKLSEVDSPNGSQGLEAIFWITEAAGAYRLEVRSLEAGAAAGRYEAKIEELRVATVQDRLRVAAELAAERAFAEAVQLEIQGTEESRRQAIEKHKESLLHRRVTGDRAREAMTLNYMAIDYDALGEVQKALELYNQALPVFQALGDRYGEAAALNNIGRVYDYIGDKQKALDIFNQSLPLVRAVGERGGEGMVLNNIGRLYDELGEQQRAIDFYNQAVVLNRSIGDRGGQAQNLNNIVPPTTL